MNDAQAILNLVREYFEADGISHRLDDDNRMIEAEFGGRHSVYAVQVRPVGDPLHLLVLLRLPFRVPEDQRVRMAETITRANDGFMAGSFDLNMASGFLAFRNTMPVADGTVTREQFQRLVGCALTTADRYFRAFGRLLYGDDLTPAEVVAEVEMAR
jgi:hypothetical protein